MDVEAGCGRKAWQRKWWDGKLECWRASGGRIKQDEDHMGFWRRRCVEAREAFCNGGYVAIHVRVLQRIFRFSKRLRRSKDHTDQVVRLCGIWRPEAWWRNPFSKLHHRAGTPHIKWEHVFVINFGLNWQKEIFKEDWNQREKEFIVKALKN